MQPIRETTDKRNNTFNKCYFLVHADNDLANVVCLDVNVGILEALDGVEEAFDGRREGAPALDDGAVEEEGNDDGVD